MFLWNRRRDGSGVEDSSASNQLNGNASSDNRPNTQRRPDHSDCRRGHAMHGADGDRNAPRARSCYRNASGYARPNRDRTLTGNLNARSPESVVNNNYIRNLTSPAADYTQVLTMMPGVFRYSPNGNGLTDAKIRLRGLADDFINFSFDGIAFNDTNGVSHHSATFFPAQFLGGGMVDRGPGTAATIGQATFGGSVDLLSRILEPEQRTSVSAMYGSWDTRLLNVEYESGQFGPDGGSKLLANAHELKSDGYQTYNEQGRKAAFVKFQQTLSSSTTLTLVGSVLNLKNHTPSSSATPRANYDSGDYRTLLTFRIGPWLDRADSTRYQIPSNPHTWVDVPAPTFSETYTTTTAQPYAEYTFKVGDDLRITPGIKYAAYKQDFVHFQDNGGAEVRLGAYSTPRPTRSREALPASTTP